MVRQHFNHRRKRILKKIGYARSALSEKVNEGKRFRCREGPPELAWTINVITSATQFL